MIRKILFAIVFLFLTKPVWAADLTVICNNASNCNTQPSSGAALFSVDDIKPSYNFPKEFSVINQDLDEDCYLYLKVNNIRDPNLLNQTLFTVIKDSTTIYFGSLNGINKPAIDKNLTDLFNQGTINLGKVNKGETKTYLWAVTMDPDAGNQYQGKTTQFDFDMTFECGSPFTPTPSPTPTSTPSPGKQSSMGINRPTCTNQSFEVTYTAKNDGNPVKDVEVTFSYKGGNEVKVKTDDNGYAHTFYTYSGAGEVKAVASDGYSTLTDNINTLVCLSGIGGGLIFGAQTAGGFVAGAFNQAVTEATKAAGLILGEVKGETSCCTRVEPLWWIVLLFQTLFLLRYFMQKIKAINKGHWSLVTLAITVLTIIIHWLGHPWFINRGYIESPYCHWVWLMAIINGIILASVFRYVFKEEHEQK